MVKHRAIHAEDADGAIGIDHRPVHDQRPGIHPDTDQLDLHESQFLPPQLGDAILLISTELEELFAVSDRILVMYEGRIVGEVPADRSHMEDVGRLIAGKVAK